MPEVIPEEFLTVKRRLDITREYSAPHFSPIDLSKINWKCGLAVRMPNHLGDAVMALPALYQLKKMLSPELKLVVITPKSVQQLYAALPWVNGCVELASVHKKWQKAETSKLKAMNLGVGILFNHSFRDAFYMRMAGINCLCGSDRRFKKLLLKHTFRHPERKKNQAAEIHQSRVLLEMVYALGAPNWDGKMPPMVPVLSAEECSPAVKACAGHSRLMIMAPGAAYGAAKRYPAESFREVAADWLSRGGIAAILGSKSERDIGKDVMRGLNPHKIYNFCGETDLAEVMVLMKNAVLAVANDSGLMHLGAWLETPGVAIFGPTDLTATGPISPSWRLVQTELSCGPCFKRVCPKADKPECMLNIRPEEVIESVEDILSELRYNFPTGSSEQTYDNSGEQHDPEKTVL